MRSLLFRLSAAAAVLVVLAMTLAAFGLRAIFSREIDRRAAIELGQIVRTIAAQVRVDPQGGPVLDVALPDLRFETPYGGLYWQIGNAGGRFARSRSLWDFVLTVPDPRPKGERWETDLAGPAHSTLLAVVQDVSVPSPTGELSFPIVAALDRSDLAASQQSMFRLLVLSLSALGVILVIAMSVFIRLALQPFGELARGLQTIHAGTSRSLPGRFPDEVQPVVNDLNRLIAFHDAAMARAKTQAGDLAHALKTPLSILGAVARQAAGEGRQDLAAPIDEQLTQMRRQVDRVLARARASVTAALGHKAVPVAAVVAKVIRAFRRLPDGQTLDWEYTVAPDAVFPGEEGDLTEVLGNLLDNARKWAKSRVRVTAGATAGVMTLRIEDDGPGLPSEAAPIARGKRWDETQPGTGFGLAITEDLVEGHGGDLELTRSDLGGLCAVVRIPLRSSAKAD